MLDQLSGIKGLIRHQKYVGVVLLLTHQKLTKIDWAGNSHGKAIVHTHTVYVWKVIDSPKILVFGHIAEKAHSLLPTVTESFIYSHCQFVFQELVKYRPQEIHTRVLPKSALIIQNFMAKNISDWRQFIVRTLFIELEQCLKYIIG